MRNIVFITIIKGYAAKDMLIIPNEFEYVPINLFTIIAIPKYVPDDNTPRKIRIFLISFIVPLSLVFDK